MDMVYEWANDPVTRANSFNSNPIPYDTHVKWYRDVLSRSDVALLIMVDRDEVSTEGAAGSGACVGQMRINVEDGMAELSYAIAPDYRRRGYGRQIIADTLEYIDTHITRYGFVELIYAQVKPGNLGSQEMLVYNGFTRAEFAEDHWTYVYPGPKQKQISGNTNNNINKLYIRVDMNPTIATGHMMRCLSIADAARDKGNEVCFICADDYPAELLKSRGYKYVSLESDWQDKESELEALISYIKAKSIEKLLIDSYQVTESYLAKLTEVTQTIYIDDLNAFKYPVNLIVTYANYYKKWNLDKIYANTHLILGTDYVPLRAEFKALPPKKISEHIENILVMSGGSDNLHIIKNILARLSKKYANNKVNITAICGRYNEDYSELEATYNQTKDITVIQSVPNLIDYIQASDIVITAGGTTLYEISACGTPAITYSFADNQLDNVLQFDEDGLMGYAGDMRADSMSDTLDHISMLLDIYDDKKRRQDASIGLQKLVDGCGADRIVEEIL